MDDPAEKAKLFRELHVPGKPFVLANAHDVGTAKMLVALGAKAVATTSAGHAFALGRPDGGTVTRDEALDHAEDIVKAVSVPVSGDFENGFADDPGGVAETVELAVEIGLAGCSIEDTTFDAGKPAYDIDIAVARIAAAVEAAEESGSDFVLTARADGVMTGAYDLAEGIARLQAFEDAGAHCVYLPLPKDMNEIATICASVSAPVNALCAGRFAQHSLADFAKAGVARVSVGSALARVTHRMIHDVGGAMIAKGDFSGLKLGMGGDAVDTLLEKGGA